MTSPFSIPLRLSSPPAVVNFTEVYDNPFSEEVSKAPGADSEVSLPPLTSQPQADTNPRRIWDGAAGRAWFEEVIAIRNSYQLYNLPWSHRHWKEVSRRLGERGFDRHWKVVKSYYNNMKARWNDRCTLLGQSGFGIDEEGKLFVQDSVWNKFVEVSICFGILLYYMLTFAYRHSAAAKKSEYNWHRKHVFPHVTLAEDLFADSNRATGETANDVEDLAEHEITDVPRFEDDQQLPGNDENEGENACNVGEGEGLPRSSRKRALTTTAPILTITKKTKPMEILATKVDRIIEAMTKPLEIVTKPLEIVDNNQKVLRDAMACWNREFKSESTDIKLAFMEEWQKNTNAALQFVLLEPEDRKISCP